VTAVLLAAGCLVIAGGLVLLGGVVAANVRKSSYDVDAAIAAHTERRKTDASLTVLEQEEAVS
jgi:hypothetical protein